MKPFKKYLLSFNWYWKVIHVIAFIAVLFLACCKCFAGWIELGHPLDIHGPSGDELMMEWNHEQQKQQEEEAEMMAEYAEAVREEQNQQSWDCYYDNQRQNEENK